MKRESGLPRFSSVQADFFRSSWGNHGDDNDLKLLIIGRDIGFMGLVGYFYYANLYEYMIPYS